MDIGYYIFALFIFVLVCIVLVLGKYLYSDTKRQNKMLDEKETKLLRLYQTVEESLEEFFDQVGESKNEIKMLGALYAKHEEISAGLSSDQTKPALGDPAFEQPRFQYVIDDFYDKPPSMHEENHISPSRFEAILNLWSEGRQIEDIAENLGITKTEVALVLDLNGDRQK